MSDQNEKTSEEKSQRELTGWNFRVMRRVYHTPAGDFDEYGIYEVYYDEKDKPNGWSTDPTPISSESMEGLQWMHDRIGEALAKPILEYGNG